MAAFVVILPSASPIQAEDVQGAFERCQVLSMVVHGWSPMTSAMTAKTHARRKAEQRHAASKEDLHGAETRLNQAISALEVRLVALSERTDAIKEHYATKWFILTSMIAVGSLIVAAMKLL